MALFHKFFNKKAKPAEFTEDATQDKPFSAPATNKLAVDRKDAILAPPQTHTPNTNLPNPPPPKLAGTLGNAGMQTGVLASVAGVGGGSMTDDLLLGQVGGTMIGQRIDQAKSHAYWKERQQEFNNGNEEAVKNPAGKSEREKGREERRKNRWSRRAERREG